MTPPTLAPPPPQTRTPEPVGPPVRAPLSGAMQPRGLRITRRGLVLSIGVHVVLGIAVWFSPIVQRSAPRTPPKEQVEYLDVAAFPEGVPQGAVLPAGAAAGPSDFVEPGAQADTATGAPSALPAFPQRVPTGVARPAGGATVPGTGPRAGVPGTGTDYSTGPRTGAANGRLGIELGDRRLIVRGEAVPQRPLTDDERFQTRLADQINAIKDSIADENGHQRRLRNWTIKDRNGREWGFGEGGKTVIAGRSLPLPIPTPNIGRDIFSEEDNRASSRRSAESQRQGLESDRDNSLRARVRATRERVDADRRRAREGVKPDTAS